MSKPIKLKPCPFCAETDIKMWYGQGLSTLNFRGVCTACDASGGRGRSEKGAAEKWNRRAGK